MNKWETFFKDLVYILRTSPKQPVLQSGCSNFRKYSLKQMRKSLSLVKLWNYYEEKERKIWVRLDETAWKYLKRKLLNTYFFCGIL